MYPYFDIFSYATSWENEIYRKTLLKHIKDTYRSKAIILLIFFPVDIFIFLFECLIIDRKSSIIFITKKWPDLYSYNNKYRKIFIGPPSSIYFAMKHRGIYIPASFLYLIVSVYPSGKEFRSLINLMAIKVATYTLGRFATCNSVLVHHSDALPFARSYVMAAKKNKIRSVCLQHGIFHENFISSERDGFISDINIVRSEYDASLMRDVVISSEIIVLSDLFLLPIKRYENDGNKYVILVGEGFDVIDKKFSSTYIEKLKKVENELSDAGYKVKYRPHPSERRFFSKFDFQDYDLSSLDLSFSMAIAYIGYSSTLLIEAAENGIHSFNLTIDKSFRKDLNRGSYKINPYTIENFINGIKIPSKENNNFHRRKSSAVNSFYKIILPKND